MGHFLYYILKKRFFVVVMPIFISIVLVSQIIYYASTQTAVLRSGREMGNVVAFCLGGVVLFAVLNFVMRRFMKLNSAPAGHRLDLHTLYK